MNKFFLYLRNRTFHPEVNVCANTNLASMFMTMARAEVMEMTNWDCYCEAPTDEWYGNPRFIQTSGCKPPNYGSYLPQDVVFLY